jgi:hypothetical protein
MLFSNTHNYSLTGTGSRYFRNIIYSKLFCPKVTAGGSDVSQVVDAVRGVAEELEFQIQMEAADGTIRCIISYPTVPLPGNVVSKMWNYSTHYSNHPKTGHSPCNFR